MYTRKAKNQYVDLYRCGTQIFSSKSSSQFLEYFRFIYPLDYTTPKVKTDFPGPNTQALLNDYASFSGESEFAGHFLDLKKSKGNFFRDVDGNTVLDLAMHGGKLPLGYNHDKLVNARDSPIYDEALAHSANLAEFPSSSLPDLLRDAMLTNAPFESAEFHLASNEDLAMENAIKTAFLKYQENEGITLRPQLDSDYSNVETNYSVLSFTNSTHGKTIGGLSASQGGAGKMNGVPSFNWAVADFPKIQYPMSRFEQDNIAAENAALAQAETIISERLATNPVAAVVIEPITQLNNEMATPVFYQKLRDICKTRGISLIVDETSTGVGITGKYWAHEHWYLENHPDFVVFGGAAQVSGFYTTPDFRPLQTAKLHSIGNGDLLNLIRYRTIQEVMKKKDLMWKVGDSSTFMKIELERMRKKNPFFSRVRGYGNFIGFDMDGGKTKKFQHFMLKSGVYTSVVGAETIGIRGSLVLEPKHLPALRDSIAYFDRY